MMCLLEIAHNEPFVDLTRTDLDAIEREVSMQIEKSALRYPFIYGGLLYRRAAELFPDRRVQLNSDETVELLDGAPQGVFQVGDLVVGPYGLRKSDQTRWLTPETRIPLQHCSDVTCRRVHVTALSTDYDASINQHLHKVPKAFGRSEVVAGAWTEFAGLISEAEDQPYDDFNMMGVPAALGDCFDDHELAAIARGLGVEIPKSEDSAELRSRLLQLIWLKRDVEIVRAIDALVDSGDIEMGEGEVRRPRLAVVEVGTYRLRTEVGRFGVRLTPDSSEVPHLRLTRMVSHLYDLSHEEDRVELAWQLRGVDGSSLEERLEDYLRLTPPAEVVRSLVMSRRRNVEQALAELRVDAASANLGELLPADDDEKFVGRILWKLGFDLDLQPAASSDFRKRHAEMRQTLRDAEISSVVDVERVREVGLGLFISLEGLLQECLEFSWWALCTDHLTAGRPFTYKPSQGAAAWAALDSYQQTLQGVEKIRLGTPRTLYALGQSFDLLARFLESLVANPEPLVRAPETLPSWVEQTELKEFRLRHTVPFLDLTDTSRERILSGFRRVSRFMKEGNVSGIRNSMAHFQRSSSDFGAVDDAISAAGRVVEIIQNLGLIRVEYRMSRTTLDEWGRALVVMRSAEGDEVTFSRPSRIGYVGLPGLGVPQYLVRSAVFGSPNEILRFRAGVDSPYDEMWEGYPLPRRPRRGRFEIEADSAAAVAQASHAVLPKE